MDLWPGTDGEWHRTLAADSEWREPRLGYWWTFCCEKDLEEIKSEAQMASIWLDRDLGAGARVWPTKEEALKELAEGHWESEVVHESAAKQRTME
jgi:hypothetical protein